MCFENFQISSSFFFFSDKLVISVTLHNPDDDDLAQTSRLSNRIAYKNRENH